MSRVEHGPARDVLGCIDRAEVIHDRHPSLFAEALAQERSARWLLGAWERYKRDRRPASWADRQHDHVEAVEGEWLDAEAETRREFSDGRKRRFAADRRSARANLSTREMLAIVFAVEQTFSAVSAANIAAGGGGDDKPMPPHQHPLLSDPRYEHQMRQLRRHAENLLDLQEEGRGLGIATVSSALVDVEKDEEILARVGETPGEVVKALGKQVAGATRTVERVRQADGRCRWCGQHMPDGGTGR